MLENSEEIAERTFTETKMRKNQENSRSRQENGVTLAIDQT
jgi:hypothetical protein